VAECRAQFVDVEHGDLPLNPAFVVQPLDVTQADGGEIFRRSVNATLLSVASCCK
jgi:hypothetical protein